MSSHFSIPQVKLNWPPPQSMKFVVVSLGEYAEFSQPTIISSGRYLEPVQYSRACPIRRASSVSSLSWCWSGTPHACIVTLSECRRYVRSVLMRFHRHRVQYPGCSNSYNRYPLRLSSMVNGFSFGLGTQHTSSWHDIATASTQSPLHHACIVSSFHPTDSSSPLLGQRVCSATHRTRHRGFPTVTQRLPNGKNRSILPPLDPGYNSLSLDPSFHRSCLSVENRQIHRS